MRPRVRQGQGVSRPVGSLRLQLDGWKGPWWFAAKRMPPSETSRASGNSPAALVCTKFPSWPGRPSSSLPLRTQDGGLEAAAAAAGCSSPAARGRCAEDQRVQHQDVWGQQDVQPDHCRFHRLCECRGERSSPGHAPVPGRQLAWGRQTPTFRRYLSMQVSMHAPTCASISLCLPPPTRLSMHTPHTHFPCLHSPPPPCSSPIPVSSPGRLRSRWPG